jgi:hypothetical protein
MTDHPHRCPGTPLVPRLAALLAVPMAVPLAVLLAAPQAAAQEPAAQEPAAQEPTAPAAEPEAGRWEFSFSAYQYFPPGETAYLQPTLQADRDWLHLEARWNYEDRDTGSAWIGWNFSLGSEVTWEVTPMIGAVFGDTDGIAPGYHSTLSWWRLEAYSEGEYVVDLDSHHDNFFYTWSEFTIAPTDWLRAGVVVQRTKVYETDFDVQRGLLVAASFDRFDATASWFNPDEGDDSFFVFSFGLGF